MDGDILQYLPVHVCQQVESPLGSVSHTGVASGNTIGRVRTVRIRSRKKSPIFTFLGTLTFSYIFQYSTQFKNNDLKLISLILFLF